MKPLDRVSDLPRSLSRIIVGRPVGAQSDSTTTVFRAHAGDSVAERVTVKFGKASVNQIVVLEGLEPGDIVALADTTQWSGKDRLVID